MFDCIYYNGQSLMNKPLSERRKHLTDHMKEAGNHVKFSEMKYIVKKNKLGDMIKDVLKKGLEGERTCSVVLQYWIKSASVPQDWC